MMYHGSHPEHPMRVLKSPKVGVLCSICKACAHPSMAEWCVCMQEGCGYILCWKCSQIEELLFDTPQAIIRNPVLAHEDMTVCLRTRPRGDAHVLCPLYPGRLMIAVSSAKGSVDANETYYRLKNGGWVNAAHVVRVIPSQQLIEELARTHLRAEEHRSSELMPLENLLHCIDESFRLMDEHSPYGPIMALLTFFPLLQYSSSIHLISSEERIAFVRASLGFIHYLFHFVLDEVHYWLNNVDHRVKTTVLTLYVELLGKSLLVARDVAESQMMALPSEFGPLVTRTAEVVVQLIPIVECGTLPYGGATVSLRTPSLAARQVEIAEEQARLFVCCYNMMETTGWLLLHTPTFTYNLKDLRPLRIAVSIIPNSETLERVLCQVAASAVERMPLLQKKIHDLDVVEVAISLARRATCAESQMAVFKLISAICHKSPNNISQLASLVIVPLIALAMKAWNTVVANAAFDCFVEMAYNDPQIDNGFQLNLQNGEDCLPVCSSALYMNVVSYQMMNVYEVGEHRQALCEYCRRSHPPAGNGVLVREPQFAYFRCQCECCAGVRVARPVPPPVVPLTAAIQEMTKEGIARVVLFWLKCGESTVANAVGRLSLKIPLPEDVTVALYRALLKQNLIGYADAALAIAAQSHLPAVREMQREYPFATISQYLSCQPGSKTVAITEQTPGKEPQCDDPDGLSPSPDVMVKKNGVFLSQSCVVSPPLVDLFTRQHKIYLDGVL